MRFAHAELLWLLLLLPVIGLLAWGRLRHGRRQLARALSPVMAARLTAHLRPHARTQRLALVLLALACLTLGGARPQRGTQYVTAQRTGGDVIVALDVSESMLAEDLKPNRLQRARHEIAAILDQLKGDRVGLVAFAGAAFVQCPLTLDYAAARMFLDYMGPDLIPEPGTNLAEALRVAVRAFDEESEGYRALVLITDGEDHGGEVEAATRVARAAGVRVFAVGIGSQAGEPIPLRGAEGEIEGYKKDDEARVVLTRLDEAALQRIADETRGFYVRAGGSLGLHRVVAAIEAMEKRELQGGIRVLYEERYRYFVWPALLLLIAEFWVPLRRRKHAGPAAARAGVLVISIGLLTALGAAGFAPAMAQTPAAQSLGSQSPAGRPGAPVAGPAPGAPAVTSAGEAPALGEEEWRALFEENEVYRAKHPEDPRPLYNLGNLFHQRGDYPEATAHYEGASPRAADELGSWVQYNLGNTLFQQDKLEEAREAFLTALRADPQSEAAKINLEVTQRMLDRAQQMPDSTRQQGEQGEDQQDQEESEQQDQQGQDQQQNQQGQQDQQDRQDQQDQQDQQEGEEEQQDQEQAEQRQQDQPAEEEADEERPERDEQTRGAENDREGSAADSTLPLDELQLQQILRGLEGRERELLRERFRARKRNLQVEKDW
ncbi:MAG: VWA domain-containing protein [Candidatus Eisenbacteria sp.]|nr:VWA domain-containing protein [Candidatus Eisenbacteria bacterium]